MVWSFRNEEIFGVIVRFDVMLVGCYFGLGIEIFKFIISAYSNSNINNEVFSLSGCMCEVFW